MKDKDKSEKETTAKKAKQNGGISSQIKPNYNAARIDALEFCLTIQSAELSEQKRHIDKLGARMQEFTDCCSTVLTRLTYQGIIISDLRKNSDMCVELTDFNKKELDHLRQSTLEFVKHVGTIEDRLKEDAEDEEENGFRLEQNCLRWMKRADEMMGELGKLQNSQCNLINQRIDRLYQDVQPIYESRGLDLDMKKIVDGLEQTVHELEQKCMCRCDITEALVDNYKRRLDAYKDSSSHLADEFYKRRKFADALMPVCLFLGLAMSCFVVTSIIRQMFF